MSLLWSILFGIVQGATEFFPVSSSAHLAFLGAIAGIKEEDALPYFLVLHLGTLLALIVFFGKDLFRLGTGVLKRERSALHLALMIILTTIPTGIIGLALKKTVEKAMVAPFWPAIFLVVTAALLFTTWFFKKPGFQLGSLTVTAALFIGTAQGIAVLPGISRSGSTIVAALACGLIREDAFRYSFLASIPAIGGAFLLDFKEIINVGGHFGTASLAAGLLSSFVVGYLSVLLLKKIVINGKLHFFGYYCLFASVAGFAIAHYLQ